MVRIIHRNMRMFSIGKILVEPHKACIVSRTIILIFCKQRNCLEFNSLLKPNFKEISGYVID